MTDEKTETFMAILAQAAKEIMAKLRYPAYREFRRAEALDRRLRFLALVEAGFTEAQAIQISKE